MATPARRQAKRQLTELDTEHSQKDSESLKNVVSMLGDLKQELGNLKEELGQQRKAAEVAMHERNKEITSLHRLIADAYDEAIGSKAVSQISEFDGLKEDDEVLNWLSDARGTLEGYLVPADKRVELAVTRFRDGALNWWRACKWQRQQAGEPMISTWEELEKEMKSYFLPYDYYNKMLIKMRAFKQGSHTVLEYTHLFEMFLWRTKHVENLDETMSRYVNGLQWNIRRYICSHNFKSLIELRNAAMRVENANNSSRSKGKNRNRH